MKTELQAAIAEYLGVAPASIDDGFRFSGDRFQGSVGMYRFMAFAKRRLARDIPALPYGCSLADAVALLTGGSVQPRTDARPAARPASPDKASPAVPNASGIRLGIDIELVDAMPEAADYRSHDFYRDTFSSAEIAYCLLHPEPRTRFCGLFCAKESFLKAGPGTALRPGDIEIGHEASGRPYYKRAGDAALPPFDLSISHSGLYAVAVAAAYDAVPAEQDAGAAGMEAASGHAGPGPEGPGADAIGAAPAAAAPAPSGRQRLLNLALGAGLALSLGMCVYLMLDR